MTHDYKAALEWILSYMKDDIEHDFQAEYRKNVEALRHALKIAEKLMEEPSGGMVQMYIPNGNLNGVNYRNDERHEIVFKAMRDQMLKEIG